MDFLIEIVTVGWIMNFVSIIYAILYVFYIGFAYPHRMIDIQRKFNHMKDRVDKNYPVHIRTYNKYSFLVPFSGAYFYFLVFVNMFTYKNSFTDAILDVEEIKLKKYINNKKD